jgi:hypothetical protein
MKKSENVQITVQGGGLEATIAVKIAQTDKKTPVKAVKVVPKPKLKPSHSKAQEVMMKRMMQKMQKATPRDRFGIPFVRPTTEPR